MKHKIPENISFLVKKISCTQDEFGDIFGLKRGAIGSYINESAKPKIETLIKITEYFDISLDDLVLKDLSAINNNRVNEPQSNYDKTLAKSELVMAYKEALAAKDETIRTLKERIEQYKSTRGKATASN